MGGAASTGGKRYNTFKVDRVWMVSRGGELCVTSTVAGRDRGGSANLPMDWKDQQNGQRSSTFARLKVWGWLALAFIGAILCMGLQITAIPFLDYKVYEE